MLDRERLIALPQARFNEFKVRIGGKTIDTFVPSP